MMQMPCLGEPSIVLFSLLSIASMSVNTLTAFSVRYNAVRDLTVLPGNRQSRQKLLCAQAVLALIAGVSSSLPRPWRFPVHLAGSNKWSHRFSPGLALSRMRSRFPVVKKQLFLDFQLITFSASGGFNASVCVICDRDWMHHHKQLLP